MTLRARISLFCLAGLWFGIGACADPPDPPPPPPASCDCALLAKTLEKAQAAAKPCPAVPPDSDAAAAAAEKAHKEEPATSALADLDFEDFPAFAESAQAAEVRRYGKAQSLLLKLPKKFTATDKSHRKSLLLTLLKGSASIQLGEEKAATIKVGGQVRLPAQTVYSLKSKKETVWLLLSEGPL